MMRDAGRRMGMLQRKGTQLTEGPRQAFVLSLSLLLVIANLSKTEATDSSGDGIAGLLALKPGVRPGSWLAGARGRGLPCPFAKCPTGCFVALRWEMRK